jgi:antitoxin (DNA-binding transcriptional repressor) of toxin-antitoxin stability system
MMSEISVQEAQSRLAELIANLRPGEEVEITQGNQTVARLIGQKRQRQFGLGKGKLTILQEDDEHLEDFKEYMT